MLAACAMKIEASERYSALPIKLKLYPVGRTNATMCGGTPSKVTAPDGDTINLYYGAADSSIALAHGSIRALLSWLDANGHSDQQTDRRHRSPKD